MNNAKSDAQQKDKVGVRHRFARRLGPLRRRRGLSATQLSKLSGVVKQQIAHYELGKGLPSATTLDRLAEVLEVERSALIPDEDMWAVHSNRSPALPATASGAVHHLDVRQTRRDSFAGRLKDQLLVRGWSQAEFAKIGGFTADNVSSWCTGRVFPTPQNLEAISNVLDVAVNDLTGVLLPENVSGVGVPFSLQSVPNDPSQVDVRVSCRLPLSVASQIAELIAQNHGKIPHAKRSS